MATPFTRKVPVIFKSPATPNLYPGVVVPIPTLPLAYEISPEVVTHCEDVFVIQIQSVGFHFKISFTEHVFPTIPVIPAYYAG